MAIGAEHERLLFRVAQAYYHDALTQEQIAARLGLSRPKVSRLLRQAREEGVVRIVVVPPAGANPTLETALERRYGLDEAVVVAASDADDIDRVALELGPAAAECLLRSLRGEEIVGITWGRTVSATVDALPHRNWPRLTIAQLSGGLGPSQAREHSTQLAQRAAARLGAAVQLVPAPGIVSSPEAARALRADPQVAQGLAMAARADVALVGLGIPAPDTMLVRHGAMLGHEDLQALRAAGAVGDVALRFLDAEGRSVDVDLEARIVGLTLDELRRIPRIIGVAGGRAKLPIVRAALRARVLHALVTDESMAECLLADA